MKFSIRKNLLAEPKQNKQIRLLELEGAPDF